MTLLENRTSSPGTATATGGDVAAAEVKVQVPTRLSQSRRVLRFGSRPLLVTLDFAAICLASWRTEAGLVYTLGTFLLVFGLFAAGGLYRSRLGLSLLGDLPALVARLIVAVAMANAGRPLLDEGPERHRLIATTSLLVIIFTLGLRGLGYAVVRGLRRSGFALHNTLILGAGSVGGRLASLFQTHRQYGLQPVGFLDAEPHLAPAARPVPVVGSVADLTSAITALHVRVVVIAFGSMRESEMVDVLRTCDRLRCEIFVVPRLFELQSLAADMESVWGLPLVRLRRSPFRSPQWRFKRAFDVAISGLALVVLLPLFALIALAVRLEGGPGVFFRQERVGLDGRLFLLLKFRSLRPDDDAEAAVRWNVADDARVGRVGRFLRKSSLDELPQLLNVLRGHMSLVGPRPERPHFVREFERLVPRYPGRYRVPAGLTGWAQVHGLRGDTSIEERARFDNFYIENWSMWTDVRTLVLTIGSFMRGSG